MDHGKIAFHTLHTHTHTYTHLWLFYNKDYSLFYLLHKFYFDTWLFFGKQKLLDRFKPSCKGLLLSLGVFLTGPVLSSYFEFLEDVTGTLKTFYSVNLIGWSENTWVLSDEGIIVQLLNKHFPFPTTIYIKVSFDL